MIERVINAPNQKVAAIQRLRASKNPVIIYGAGSYANDVIRFLAGRQIRITTACVDDAYLTPDQTIADGIPVIGRATALKRYPNSPIVIGFSDFVKAREQLAAAGSHNEIFFIDAPDRLEFFDWQFIKDHEPEFAATYAALADQRSKDVMVAFINSKITGDPTPLYPLVQQQQYFNEPIELTNQETFIDCGAYNGDTLQAFLKAVNGQYRQILCFEPDQTNYEALERLVTNQELKQVRTVNAGVWSSRGSLSFVSNSNTATIAATGVSQVAVETIDDALGNIQPTYIKMDVEGAEQEGLRGAERTIKRDLPKLAICVYHKPEDLITLPQMIKQFHPGYRLFLRHYQHISWETVLYALPD